MDDHFTCIITKYSHHFSVYRPTPDITKILYRLAADYTESSMVFDPVRRKKVWRPVKTYAIYIDRGREFRLHIGQWYQFKNALLDQFVDKTSYVIREYTLAHGEEVDLNVKEGWELRDFQPDAVDFIIAKDDPTRIAPMVMVPMGKGKTFLSLYAAAKLKKRFAVVLLAGYVDQWVKNIQKILDVEADEIARIQGSDSLQRCTNYPDSGLPIPKVFVIALTTLQKWYGLYEESRNHHKLEAYACSPYEFFQHLGIGTVIFDEVHQHPYGVYRCHAYLHTEKTINLSATLFTENPVIRKVQSMMFPMDARFDSVKMDKYITVHACTYQILDYPRTKLQTTEWGSNTYSHTAYEKSILRNSKIKRQYLGMICDLIAESYDKDYMDGDRLIIFIATRAMAEELLIWIEERFPKYDTRTFLEGDPEENVTDSDIRISTIIKSGAALDIAGLRVTIQTISMKSPNSNLQVLGRLRPLKDRDVHFYHIFCSSIPKHAEYYHSKVELFQEWSKAQKKRFLTVIRP